MATYSVEIRDGCTILRGSVPISHFAALAKTGSSGAVIDVDLASRLGATFVFGCPQNLEKLRGSAPPRKLPAAVAALSLDAKRWLESGERGASSEALFDAALACSVAVDGRRQGRAHPLDPADFNRCVKMLSEVPEALSGLARARSLSAEWAAFVDNWEQLSNTLKRELEASSNGGRAPATMALINKILEHDVTAGAKAGDARASHGVGSS